MSNEQKNTFCCPECGEKIGLIPIREPLPESSIGGTYLTQTASTFTGSTYSPTSKTYKCSNPKCWVTKVELNWE